MRGGGAAWTTASSAPGPGKLCQALGITRDLDGRMMPRSAGRGARRRAVALPFEVAHHAAHRHHQGGGLAAHGSWWRGVRTCRDGALEREVQCRA